MTTSQRSSFCYVRIILRQVNHMVFEEVMAWFLARVDQPKNLQECYLNLVSIVFNFENIFNIFLNCMSLRERYQTY